MGRPLTITDLCELSGYSRHQMHGLLKELPMYSKGKRSGTARVAKTYSMHDLVVVTLCCRLETRYGMKRQSITGFAEDIARILGGPDKVTRAGRLILKYEPLRVDYVEQLRTHVDDGLVIALEPIIASIEQHLTPVDALIPKHQTEFNYGLIEVKAGRKDGA